MKGILISGVTGALIIAGAVLFSAGTGAPPEDIVGENNVSIVDGKQIIELDARGGYFPVKSTAQAGIPTIIRFNTRATFDCSSAVRIPSMNISRVLPQTGKTDIDVGVQKVGVLEGTCGMGMYPFEIEFTS
jgi:plastocyanin domain-containing protein